MKKLIKFFFIISFLSFGVLVFADPPAPPGNPSDAGGVPVGAPIDGGLGILLAMGAAYGGKKLYKARKDKKEKKESEIISEDQL